MQRFRLNLLRQTYAALLEYGEALLDRLAFLWELVLVVLKCPPIYES